MGAAVQSRDGKLVLRLWHQGRRWPERTTWPDTPENRAKAERYAARVSEAIKAGDFGPARYLHFFPHGLRAAEMQAALGIEVQETAQPTFDRYATEWLARQSVKAKRYKELNTAIKKLAATQLDGVRIGAMRLRAITPAVLEAARGQWVGAGLKMKSARNYLQGSLSGLFATALDVDHVVKVNPCLKLRWPAKEIEDPDPFTAEERDKILAKLREAPLSARKKGTVRRWSHGLIAFLFATGMRPSEATGLTWGDVDLSARRVFIRRSRVSGIVGSTKTRASRRTVRLSQHATDLLRELRPLHPGEALPVFTTPSRCPINQDRFAKTHWRAALSSAEVRPRRLYDTRCTFISLAVSGGVDLFWISRQVGASVATLEKHYARYLPHADEAQLMRLNEALEKIGSENGPVLVRRTSGETP